MSQDFHQGVVFSFSNGFERSTMIHQDQHQQQHIGVQQNPRDKLRLQGFELQPPPPPPPLVGIEEEETGELPVYETGGMLSEMFGFQSGVAPVATDLLDNQIPENYRLQRPSSVEGIDWYGKQHQIPSINADSASAMQLFLMNPHQRSPSPPSHPPPTSSSTLHEFHSSGVTDAAFGGSPIPPAQFNWVTESGGGHNTITQQTSSSKFGGVVESQGLSLSLSSLQHLQAAKAEELRIEDGGMFYYNQGDGVSSSNSYQLKNLGNHMQQMHLQGVGQNQQIHVGYSSVGVVNILRNSKYLKAAHELLEEFCSVGRGQLKNNMIGRLNKNPNTNMGSGGSSSSSKDLPPLLAAERIEHQRRKAALLSMLDEVDRKYGHYCEQMQMVVNSFDSVMGYGAATPYTSLAQKAMSRHFRCLKDAITTQLKLTRDLLGDKEGLGALGVTKGETPRLKLLDQSLRQQRAFHQMGMMEQEAWRPQRGLPERSVNILRAWLFEHFLHPYPSDADKHLLARQTGLSRNQVSNWFINARVRLWKPMVEEMYQQESKDAETTEEEEREILEIERERDRNQSSSSAQTPTPTTPTTQARTTTATTATAKRSEIDALENDPSLNAINGQCFSENKATKATTTSHSDVSPTLMQRISMTHESSMHHHHQLRDVVIGDTCHHGGIVDADYGSNCTTMEMEPSPLIRFGSNTGDVSLTLGLRHAGNLPEKNRFSVGDYRS